MLFFSWRESGALPEAPDSSERTAEEELRTFQIEVGFEVLLGASYNSRQVA
ncbi:hypothetical protein [Algoriphagus boritolerans]|uniref:hypothetical protein n=1 Tax=Algoriphagus boritolerans TaxID=308111 RepID=UPI000AF3FBAB